MPTANTLSKILIVGAGKVAFHLASEMQNHPGHFSIHVFSRNVPADLSHWPWGIQWYHEWSSIPPVDLVLLAVSDHAIKEVAVAGASMPALHPALWVHTSGATSVEVFHGVVPRYGLFYPLQSFSKSIQVQWSKIPVGIDAVLDQDLILLQSLANVFGADTFTLQEDQRKRLHLAAVFANNFTNHCLGIAADIMEQSGLDFDLLKPLIEITCQKAFTQHPFLAQTGPAIRGDDNTIENHEKLLAENFSNYLEMYKAITLQIQLTHASKK